MNVVIIEDEKLSAEHLTNLLKRIDKTIQVVAYFDSVKATISAFSKGLQADLVFMDIHLADGLSFDIFPKFSQDIPVIFTTAFDEYAIKAFKFNSIDYLLKPIGLLELEQALDKFKRLKDGQGNQKIKDLQVVYENLQHQYRARFMVKIGDGIGSVKAEDISHFVSEEGVVLICTSQLKRYAIDQTLDDLLQQIDPSVFFRINRKVIVNINAIQKVSSYFNSRLKINISGLADDDCVISRERVSDFKTWLGG